MFYSFCRHLLLASLLGLTLSSTGEAQTAPVPPTQKQIDKLKELTRAILTKSHQLWALLSQIASREEADKAQESFVTLTQQLIDLDQQLGALEQENSAILPEELNLHIIESYRLIDEEFCSIYRKRCYGSAPLYSIFQSAIESGFFDTSMIPPNHPELPALDGKEEAAELERIKKLVAPDKEILRLLALIVDNESANSSCEAMADALASLEELQADNKILYRNFSQQFARKNRSILFTTERLLWDMRSEYVRIAALPLSKNGIPNELLANTLDELYFTLELTHHHWFDYVFDASFLIDMDDAFRESDMEAAIASIAKI